MKRVIAALGLVAAALTFAVVGAFAHTEDGDGTLKDERHFKEQALKEYEGGNKGGAAWNMVAVGHIDLAARGFNADVWQHEGFAYVGQWGRAVAQRSAGAVLADPGTADPPRPFPHRSARNPHRRSLRVLRGVRRRWSGRLDRRLSAARTRPGVEAAGRQHRGQPRRPGAHAPDHAAGDIGPAIRPGRQRATARSRSRSSTWSRRPTRGSSSTSSARSRRAAVTSPPPRPRSAPPLRSRTRP